MTILPSNLASDYVPLKTYSAALDEIYFLRSQLAHEARCVDTALSYKTMPQRVRTLLERSRGRLSAGARGEQGHFIPGTKSVRFCLRWAGASETLTRGERETQRGIKGDA